MSYLDLGYNAQLERVLLPVENVSAVDYDALYEDGSIISSKVLANAITNEKINAVDVTKLTAGVLNVEVEIGVGTGGAYVRLDGVNNRIVVHDGTTPRIVIGDA